MIYFMGLASDKVILFVSDGDNLDGDNALTVIRDRNERLGNSVVIHTFAIGKQDCKCHRFLKSL